MERVWGRMLTGRPPLDPGTQNPVLSGPTQVLPSPTLSSGDEFCRARRDVSSWSLWLFLLLLHVSGTCHPGTPCPWNPQQHLGPAQTSSQDPSWPAGGPSMGWVLRAELATAQTFGLRCPHISNNPLQVWDGTRGGSSSRVISQPRPLLELLLLAPKIWGWPYNLGTPKVGGRAEVSDGQVPRLEQGFFSFLARKGLIHHCTYFWLFTRRFDHERPMWVFKSLIFLVYLNYHLRRESKPIHLEAFVREIRRQSRNYMLTRQWDLK